MVWFSFLVFAAGELPARVGLELRSGIDGMGFDLDFVGMDDELSPESEWLPLQDQVDEYDGFARLIVVAAACDLPGVKLE
jgi:hypothetical protein